MRLFTIMFIILILLSGCSNKPSLELISSSVEIRDDRSGRVGINSGEKTGEFIEPISLSYDFILKNTGKKTLGKGEKLNKQTFKFDDGIKVLIEPHEKLVKVSKEVMDFNLYSDEERQESELGLGYGERSIAVLEPNQEGEYSFDFVLGASEENPEMAIAPSPEQLNKLKRSAMDATLIIFIEDEEIARFDLSKSN